MKILPSKKSSLKNLNTYKYGYSLSVPSVINQSPIFKICALFPLSLVKFKTMSIYW